MVKGLSREDLARRAARELRDGGQGKLAIGIPALVSHVLETGSEIVLQSDSGLLGLAARPAASSALPASAVLSSDQTADMVRGGHVDVAIVGAAQVSESGDLSGGASSAEPGAREGALKAIAGAKRVVVVMEHTAKDGAPKILKECSLPLAGRRMAHRIITELAVMDVAPEGLVLREVAPGVSAREVQERTEPTLKVPSDLCEIVLGTP